MMYGRALIGATTLAFAAQLLCAHISGAMADEAASWVNHQQGAMRLVAGSHARHDPVYLAGIEIKLGTGWKTYWRHPGDSGVPPRFDFARSENIDTVTVLWPLPTIFADGAGGSSIGYRERVLLPLRVTPKDSEKPVVLRVEAAYGVCEKLCVPVEVTSELKLTDITSMHDGTLAAALESVPVPLRDGETHAVSVTDLSYQPERKRMTISLAAPTTKPLTLLAEGPSPDWWTSVPKLTTRTADGIQRFTFDIEPPPTHPDVVGTRFKVTIAGDGRPVETTRAAR